jgi:RNA polymerase sigma-70 factor (ECF subfamily)
MPELDDRDLVVQALAGEKEAFGTLVKRFERPVYGLIVRMVRNPAEAEEIAQEVFIKAYTKLQSFDRSRKFSSWIFKIAHNAAIDYLRKKRVQTVPLESPPEQEGGQLADILAGPERDEPEQVAVRGELAEALELAMASLRPEQREVLLLRFQHGLSYAELSEVMSLPLGTIKTHLHRARKRLAQIFEGTEWDPEELGK